MLTDRALADLMGVQQPDLTFFAEASFRLAPAMTFKGL
jgi:hypothetical protein